MIITFDMIFRRKIYRTTRFLIIMLLNVLFCAKIQSYKNFENFENFENFAN